MSEALKNAIDEMVNLISAKQREVADIKRSINIMCRQLGEDPMFADESVESVGFGAMRSDEYYGKSPITAARMYLERKGKPATQEEILSGLERGGFDFDEQKWEEKNRLRNLAISLGKNTIIFHRLPSGTWGLLKWYPGKKKPTAAGKASKAEDADDTDESKEAKETA